MAVKQTAGRDQLGDFAPKFAELNDDVLFGEVWSREDKLSLRDRSLVTVTALMAQGLIDDSFRYHLMTAKSNGITKEEIAEIVTHAAFYCGWPKAWAVFKMAKAHEANFVCPFLYIIIYYLSDINAPKINCCCPLIPQACIQHQRF